MTATKANYSNWLALACWLAFAFLASLSAIFVRIDGWYEALVKPSWNPPPWIFAPVWTTLYAMMGVAAWLIWRNGGWKKQSLALGLFVAQWILNTSWTPIFFGLHRLGWALVVIACLWLLLAATIYAFGRTRKLAAWLLVPYFFWVSFATALNFAIWQLNP